MNLAKNGNGHESGTCMVDSTSGRDRSIGTDHLLKKDN